MERNHDHENSYKEKIFNWAGLQFRGVVHFCYGGTWGHAGTHGAREVIENPTLHRQQEVN